MKKQQLKKVSFDFDGTLTRSDIQRLVKFLNKRGKFEVHITTSRNFENDLFGSGHNDLFKLAEELNISKDNIHFLNYRDKVIFFKDNEDFLFHLDDCWIEIDEINKVTDVIGVCALDRKWDIKCLDLINNDFLMSLDSEFIRKRVHFLLDKFEGDDMSQLLSTIKEDIEKILNSNKNKKDREKWKKNIK